MDKCLCVRRHSHIMSCLGKLFCAGKLRYIDITAGLRAVFYIARVLACNILYLPEGASPRRRYFRIARRAPKASVLYDFTARMHENDIVYIHQRAQRAGIALKTKYSPLVDIMCRLIFHLDEFFGLSVARSLCSQSLCCFSTNLPMCL